MRRLPQPATAIRAKERPVMSLQDGLAALVNVRCPGRSGQAPAGAGSAGTECTAGPEQSVPVLLSRMPVMRGFVERHATRTRLPAE